MKWLLSQTVWGHLRNCGCEVKTPGTAGGPTVWIKMETAVTLLGPAFQDIMGVYGTAGREEKPAACKYHLLDP